MDKPPKNMVETPHRRLRRNMPKRTMRDGGMVVPQNYNHTGTRSINYMSSWDKIAYALTVSVGLFYLITSIFQLAFLFTDKFDMAIFVREIIQIGAGAGLLYAASRLVKKSTFLERIADHMFEEIIQDRFEPVLREIAEVQVGYDTVNHNLEALNYNVDDLRKSIEFAPEMHAQPGIGTTTMAPQISSAVTSASLRRIYTLFTYVVMLNITLAIYMFMIYYPQWYVPYLSPLLFVMWWAAISHENKLWENRAAWFWVFAPILILPIYTMIFGMVASTNQMFAFMYVGLGLYIASYYIWGMFTARGTLPFDLHLRLKEIENGGTVGMKPS
ncbi:MAG: hypothetical protein KAH86_02700, partial [Methanosarcinales archaeon]|nr:hypothetical protein [Methanosarcinales archaeon]